MDERKKEIEEIIELIDRTPEYGHKDAVNEILDLFPQWISVEDRLPEPLQDVWATNGKEVEDGFRSILDKDSKYAWIDFGFEVTHWMEREIPQPPGEKK